MIYEQNCYNLNIKYFDNLIEINKGVPRGSILPLGPIQREFLSGTRFIKSSCSGRYIYSHEMFIYYPYLTITSLAGNLFFKPKRYMLYFTPSL